MNFYLLELPHDITYLAVIKSNFNFNQNKENTNKKNPEILTNVINQEITLDDFHGQLHSQDKMAQTKIFKKVLKSIKHERDLILNDYKPFSTSASLPKTNQPIINIQKAVEIKPNLDESELNVLNISIGDKEKIKQESQGIKRKTLHLTVKNDQESLDLSPKSY
jgi:hypothetical protein